LFDVDPVIVGVWSYLISVRAEELLALPNVVDEVPASLPQEARWLIGFWLNKGSASPCKTPSAWMRSGIRPASYWGPEIRSRLALQVEHIRHWTVAQKSYADIEPIRATWFVDPPYSGSAGRLYRHASVDFAALARWCLERDGQVVVCENEGASWLPFQPFRKIKASPAKHGGKVSSEVIWYSSEPRSGLTLF
jgi:hypothetical protein